MTETLIKTKYRIILPEHKTLSETEVKEVEWPSRPGYDLIKGLVEINLFNGAWTEHVSVWSDFDGDEKYRALDMFVDENGLMKQLPRNEVATTEYRRACLAGKTVVPPPSDPELLNFIVGPAVLFERRVWF